MCCITSPKPYLFRTIKFHPAKLFLFTYLVLRNANVKVLWLGRLLGRRFRSLRWFRSFRLAALHIAFPVKSEIVKGWKGHKRWHNLSCSLYRSTLQYNIIIIYNYQIRSTAETGTKPQVASAFCQFQTLLAVAFPFHTGRCLSRLPLRQCAAIVPSSSSSCYASMETKDSTLRPNDEVQGDIYNIYTRNMKGEQHKEVGTHAQNLSTSNMQRLKKNTKPLNFSSIFHPCSPLPSGKPVLHHVLAHRTQSFGPFASTLDHTDLALGPIRLFKINSSQHDVSCTTPNSYMMQTGWKYINNHNNTVI